MFVEEVLRLGPKEVKENRPFGKALLAVGVIPSKGNQTSFKWFGYQRNAPIERSVFS